VIKIERTAAANDADRWVYLTINGKVSVIPMPVWSKALAEVTTVPPPEQLYPHLVDLIDLDGH
jgi:hypothetical protein